MNKKFQKVLLAIVFFLFFLTLIFHKYFRTYQKVLWLFTMIIMLVTGIFFSFKYKFLQLNFPKIFKCLFTKSPDRRKRFENLFLNLGAKIGIGCLAGVSLAIYLGGPGTIFWMIISSIIVSINTYVESSLGMKYQIKTQNTYQSGPSYYIKHGLKDHKLSYLYAILIILTYILGFLPIQSNTILKSTTLLNNISPKLVFFLLMLCTCYVLLRDSKKIITFISGLVPVMTILYLILGLYILIQNHTLLPTILTQIFTEAFTLRSGLVSTIIIGIQRGVFASEAGIGTSSISESTSKNDPHFQGLFQVLGVHITILIICTITGLIIMTTPYQNLTISHPNGIELILYAFNIHLGDFGGIILCFFTILFAFSTIIAGYYYGEKNFLFLFPKANKTAIILLKLTTITLIGLGCFLGSTFLWDTVDLFVAFLAIINLTTILILDSREP